MNPSAEFEFLRWKKKELNQNKIALTWNLWSNEEEKEISDCTISKCFLSLKRICFLKLYSPARLLSFRKRQGGKVATSHIFFIVRGLALKWWILSVRLGCLKWSFTCFGEVFTPAALLSSCCVKGCNWGCSANDFKLLF